MRFDGKWRFGTPGTIPDEVVHELNALIGKIAAQGNRKAILEHFKRFFAGAAGTTASHSSSESWAKSDLMGLMWQASANAPLFIEAFYEGCEALRGYPDLSVPDVGHMNGILAEHKAGFKSGHPS